MQSNSPPINIILSILFTLQCTHCLTNVPRCHGHLAVTMHFQSKMNFEIFGRIETIWSTHIVCKFLSSEKEFAIRKVFATVHAEWFTEYRNFWPKKKKSHIVQILIWLIQSDNTFILHVFFFLSSILTIPQSTMNRKSSRMSFYLMHTRIKSIHFSGCVHIQNAHLSKNTPNSFILFYS